MRPDAAVGELWSIFFDGEAGAHTVAKEEHSPESADARATRDWLRDAGIRAGADDGG